MQNISRLALVAVLTVGAGGIVGIASSLMPATSALAQDCRVSPTACPPTSSSSQSSSSSSSSSSQSSEPSSSQSSEPSSSESSESSSSESSEPPTSSEPSKPDDGNDPGDNPDPGLFDKLLVGDDTRIDCTIKNDKPITNDMWLINTGEHILEINTKVRWRVPATGEHGAFLLPRDIPVGAERVLRNFLADVQGGSECRIEIID